MNSYRQSHMDAGAGYRYDAFNANKVDALIWRHFVKDYVAQVFRRCEAEGLTRYLDFACGTGRILKLGAEFFPAVGIDVSAEMLSVARQRVPAAKLYCLDVTREPDKVMGPFDCVSLFRFLLNAEPTLREEALRWLAAKMRPGAVLVGNNHMETTSFGGLMTGGANLLRRRKKNHMTRRQVDGLLESTGFRVQQWTGFRILPSIGGKPPLGQWLQLHGERAAYALCKGELGMEQVFVARRV